MSPVDVGHEVCLQCPRIGMQGFRDHDRAEVRAADANIHHVRDGLAGVALPGAVTDCIHESLHLLEKPSSRRAWPTKRTRKSMRKIVYKGSSVTWSTGRPAQAIVTDQSVFLTRTARHGNLPVSSHRASLVWNLTRNTSSTGPSKNDVGQGGGKGQKELMLYYRWAGLRAIWDHFGRVANSRGGGVRSPHIGYWRHFFDGPWYCFFSKIF